MCWCDPMLSKLTPSGSYYPIRSNTHSKARLPIEGQANSSPATLTRPLSRSRLGTHHLRPKAEDAPLRLPRCPTMRIFSSRAPTDSLAYSRRRRSERRLAGPSAAEVLLRRLRLRRYALHASLFITCTSSSANTHTRHYPLQASTL